MQLKALITSGDDRKILAASGGMMAGGALVAALGMLAVGIPFQASAQPVPEPEPVQVQIPVVAAKSSPAVALVDQLLKAPAKGWTPAGGRTNGAGAPFPYSCPVPGGSAVLASSQPYRIGNSNAVLTVAVFGPGLGARAADQLADGVSACASGAGRTSQWVSGDRMWTADSTLSGNSTRATMVRRGDVVIHVSGSRSVNTTSLAGQVAKTLDGALTPEICVDPNSGVGETDRNPLSGEYKSHRVGTKVTIPDPGLPVIPSTETWAPASLSEPLKQIDAAKVTATPTWPVWPAMPTALPLPIAPELPEAEPVLSKSLQALARDTEGPGCGWAFSGSPESIYDQVKAERENAADIAAAKQELATGAGNWASDVLAYWRDASNYAADTEKYDEYVDEVTKVNAAWAVIDSQWQGYNAELALYNAREAEITRFNATQGTARTAYNDALAQCQVTQTEQLEHNRQVALNPPVVEPVLPAAPEGPLHPLAPPVTPEEVVPELPEIVEVVDCSVEVERPNILDQVAPESLPVPVQPADPRPAVEEAPSED